MLPVNTFAPAREPQSFAVCKPLNFSGMDVGEHFATVGKQVARLQPRD
jgi:hypothetical protein